MNVDHYAILIGLKTYSRLGDPPGANLLGPENDANAVYAWLTAPDEGGLPKENVKLLRSSDFPAPPDGRPTGEMLNEAFRWLDGLARAREKRNERRSVGRRLYFYASGHGFSPRFRQGCLLTGDAAEEEIAANISPTLWLDWWQDAEYFREYVLWMDCCMDRQVLTQPQPAPLKPIGCGGAPGPTFVAFAASRPLKAIEKPIPDDAGQVHGVFTWNLLRGLRGAAVNAFGMVTGGSLADWLRYAQFSWLEGLDLQNPDIAKEPAIVDSDDGLVFARALSPAGFKISFSFFNPLPAGSTVRIWSGSPPSPGAPLAVAGDRLVLDLPSGIYVLEAQGLGLRHGFTVTRDATVAVSDAGAAPRSAGGLFAIALDPGDPTAEIKVLGGRFETIDTGHGTLQARLPFGLYVLRIRVGRQIVEKVLLLDADWPAAAGAAPETSRAAPAMPGITSAAPLPQTSATHEAQQSAVKASLGRVDVRRGEGAQLMVMARVFTADGVGASGARPWDTVSVRDLRGATVADLATDGVEEAGHDPFKVCTVALPPGQYVLQHAARFGGAIAQSLVVPPGGWRLEAYLLDRPGFSQPLARLRVTLLMRRIGEAWGTAEDVIIEKARVALVDERPFLGQELAELLLRKFDNPLAGIIGGHLLLMQREQGQSPQLGWLNEVVRNLRALVGSEHPDVEALSLSCPLASLRRFAPVRGVPLFERSWRMLVEASRTNHRLVPAGLWRRVQAEREAPPFLCWAAEEKARAAYMTQLARTVFAPRADPPAPSAESHAASLALPTSAPALAGQHEAGLAPPRATPLSAPAAPPARRQAEPASRATIGVREAVERAAALGLPPVALKALRETFQADR